MLRFAFLFSIIISCSFQKIEKPKEKLTLKIRLGNWSRKRVYGADYYNVLTTHFSFFNNTDDTVSYVSMSCSWSDFYEITTKDLMIHSEDYECYQNFPIFVSIPPHEERGDTLNLETKKELSELHNTEFKIGFHFIEAKDYKNIFSVATDSAIKSNTKYIIWSESLKIK